MAGQGRQGEPKSKCSLCSISRRESSVSTRSPVAWRTEQAFRLTQLCILSHHLVAVGPWASVFPSLSHSSLLKWGCYRMENESDKNIS